MSHSRGFTLVELVIVIVLVGILSAVAAPKFFDVSSDARRSSNNATVASLNAAVSAAANKGRVTSNILTATAAAPSSTVSPRVINLDNTSGSSLYNYLGVASTSLLIATGGGRGALSTTPTLTSSASGSFAYVDILSGTTNIITGCKNLFNVLMSDNSVQSGSATAAYRAINTASPANATAFTAINGQTGSNFSSGSIAAGILLTTELGPTIGVAGSKGGCLYLMNSSASSSPKFYIFYDLSKGVFYSAESNILGS
jgi:prepilin-type N-terminal cleavage/methylation domain-containing protein